MTTAALSRKKIYADGTSIEWGHGDTYPPGHVGQHTSKIEPWARMNGGEWRHVVGVRSTHAMRELIEMAETADEAFEILMGDR